MVLLIPVAFVFGRKPTAIVRPEDVDRGRLRIRCPRCDWQPQKTDTWVCAPGCGHVWNTFETRGQCPSCSKQWTSTACLRCHEWSAHEAWYEIAPE